MNRVRDLFEQGLNKTQQKLEVSLVDNYLGKFLQQHSHQRFLKKENKNLLLEALIGFLKTSIQSELAEYSRMKAMSVEFRRCMQQPGSVEERNEYILRFAGQLGSTGSSLRKDQDALSRWFDAEALADRITISQRAAERHMCFLLNRLQHIVAYFLNRVDRSESEVVSAWEKIALETLLRDFFTHEGDNRIVVASIECLRGALMALPGQWREDLVQIFTLRFVYRASLETTLDPWIQCAALELLAIISLDSIETVLPQRIENQQLNDDIFVRARAVSLLGELGENFAHLHKMLELCVSDSSIFVRQHIPLALSSLAKEERLDIYQRIIFEDPSEKVRIVALRAALCGELSVAPSSASTLMKRYLLTEKTSVGLRAGLVLLEKNLNSGRLSEEGFDTKGIEAVVRELSHNPELPVNVQRRADRTAEVLWCYHDSKASALKDLLSDKMAGVAPGTFISFSKSTFAHYSESLLGRVLAVMALDDFGFEVERGLWSYRITRGTAGGFKLWRWLREVLNTAPDKRQAFSHVGGRNYFGEIIAPSNILAELTETRVPGEPLHITEELGWRPFLPLLDMVLSGFNRGFAARETAVFSCHGVTRVRTPGLIPGFIAYLRITWRFEQIAGLRNWSKKRKDQRPNAYVKELNKYGVEVSFKSHEGELSKPSVQKYFTGFPLFGVSLPSDLWGDMVTYFVALHENTIFDFWIFALFITLVFVVEQSLRYRSLRSARKKIPLVVGGWGTRGKSGTERLKAALFNAMGASVVSKSTGCEAMMVTCPPFMPLLEIPLFRPYDKVSIWEQRDITVTAAKLSAEVLLWECMALNPRYVDILQHHWMRDDISTITNAYPDHEDIQGPRGIDVAQVISTFVPDDAKLITTEELMLPLLLRAAELRGTSVTSLGWLEAELLAPEIIDRFPYDEHHYNIVLVQELARQLGIDPAFALKEMADRVVPDLGVLKTFPPAQVQDCTLVFTNAMSANERYGCLNSWRRVGLHEISSELEELKLVSTIVNNRADRIPRSRVFARMLVRDLRAHFHFLIGSNVKGLKSLITDEWNIYKGEILVFEDDQLDLNEVLDQFSYYAKEQLIITERGALEQLIRRLLPELSEHEVGSLVSGQSNLDNRQSEEFDPSQVRLLDWASLQIDRLNKYESLQESIKRRATSEFAAVRDEALAFLYEVFASKFILFTDEDITGEELLLHVSTLTPPGLTNHLVGIQNIKGPGLDLVYRWLAWERIFTAGTRGNNEKKEVAQNGVSELAEFASSDYGVLTNSYLEELLPQLRSSRFTQQKGLQLALDKIEANHQAAKEKVYDSERSSTNAQDDSAAITAVLGRILSGILDVGKSIERRFRADRIYKDLVDMRISRKRASEELWRLYREQS